ncbi:serine protease [Asbolus verrucosus]|uniref:Serine protease n=1 Tax=Asbolus verrucosus TaxID=1661398 RepID=A0A482W574_ASBVE|nr:serine protease [Asbolus verrucosus]
MISFLFVAFLLASASAVPPFLRSKNSLLPDGRIIGGSSIAISQVPWQVSLQYYGSHICGASIISSRYVVTAAHCTDGLSAGSLSIRAGTATRGSGGQVVSVSRINQNPNYNDNLIDYDISVLELSSALTLNSNAAAISLPSSSTSWAAGTSVLVTGWGTTREGSSSLPTALQGVTVQLVSESSCKSAYGSSSITSRMLCAGVTGGGKDACQGDSGGPLAVNGVLGGIVSWGYGCARPSYPGVYSNVPALRSYITQVTGL